MKKYIGISIILMLFGTMGTVSAATYHDSYDAGGQRMRGSWGSRNDDRVSWEFNINNDGYDSSTEYVTSAVIDLELRDDRRDPWWSRLEFARLQVGANRTRWEVDTGTARIEVDSVATLSATGRLYVTLVATWGDFYFDRADLWAETDRYGNPSAVPVPSALLLMGSGLIGIAAATRRRIAKV